MDGSSTLQKSFRLLALVSFCAILSLPILSAGYFSDDNENSLIRGYLELHHHGLWYMTGYIISIWFGSGRFIPLSFITTYLIFFLTSHTFIYQLIRVIFIWLSILSSAWLVKLITKATRAALLLILLVPMCWSIRNFHDPLTSFALILPMLTIFSTLALSFFIKYDETNNRYWLFASLMLYSLALMTYEVSLAVLVGVMILARHKKSVTPYFIMTVIYLALIFILHLASNHVYDGIKVGQASHFASTFLFQITAALPLSYRYLAHQPDINTSVLLHSFLSKGHHRLLIVYLFSVTFGLAYSLLKSFRLDNKAINYLTLMGLNLILVPAFLIGTSQKYQALIANGVGYLPVYVEYVGISCILLALLAKQSNKIVKFFLASAMSIVVTFSFLLNFETVKEMNNEWKYPRLLVEDAVQHGVLAHVPKDAVIIGKSASWNTAAFFMQFAGIDQISQNPNAKYLIDAYHFPNSKNGYVIVGHVKVARDNEYYVEHPRIFVSALDVSQYTEILQLLKSRYNLSLNQSNQSATYKVVL